MCSLDLTFGFPETVLLNHSILCQIKLLNIQIKLFVNKEKKEFLSLSQIE